MPILNVTLVRGRDLETVQNLCRELTETTERCLNVPKSSVRVIITEVEPDLFFVGGKSKAEAS